ncbi:MAG: diaminopimelate epimerase [Proteobacteria bacterium]|nr:diaminopimelate epimerase [Pseudomonadota bacterium]MBU1612633.1 diaminopimelate epimerase [Pseudomonadota bacterium]
MSQAQEFGASVDFYKLQGCGNDFVAIDNRTLKIPSKKMANWVIKVCARAFGVGADGLFFIENAPAGSGLAYSWQFFNNDGSRAEMCGNASRCAAKLAHHLEIAPASHSFGTDAGPVKAKVLTQGPDRGQVKVQLTPPKDIKLNIELDFEGTPFIVHFVDTGVPHVVVYVADVSEINVQTVGSYLRLHPTFQPAGTNVNFVQVKDPETMLCRTFERGVEGETYACGTGVSAAQLIAHKLGLTGPTARITTTGGETLTVSIEEDDLYLQGGAELVFSGKLHLDSLGLFLT